MQKPKEIAEIGLALWYLPLEKVEEVRRMVFALKKAHGYDEPVDDSDEWTAEDRQEMTEESMTRFDEDHPWEEGKGNVQAG